MRVYVCVCACVRAGVCGRIFVIFGINLTFFDICGICRILGILGLFRKCLTFLVFVLSPAFLQSPEGAVFEGSLAFLAPS